METPELMSISNGSKLLSPPEALLYWIEERNQILQRKELGLKKPWSDNAVFQSTYFCNVRREDDRVTKFVRNFYSDYVGDKWFEYNIVLSRFLNWPDTLRSLGYIEGHDPTVLDERICRLAKVGKVWGGAYVITTHGIPMAKSSYMCHNVLGGVAKALGLLNGATQSPQGPLMAALRPRVAGSLSAAHKALQHCEGLGSFLAAQVIADLKNTHLHPLEKVEDWFTFVAPGPGSIRGLSWFWSGVTITPGNFATYFQSMREYVDYHWNQTLMGKPIHNQDLQNCLCEFDKFCRVTNGTGRSKRNYPGIR